MNTLEHGSFRAALMANATAKRHPDTVTFELTYGCNLRCVHCFNPTHRALPHELNTHEVCGVLDQLAAFGVMTVTFSGGEPSVRPDIAAILRHARRQGLLVQLLSNATRVTPSFAALLREIGPEQVCISIYGATAAGYERMTGVIGSYAAFREGLVRLASTDAPVVVRMPVTSLNSHEVEACRTIAGDHGFQFQYCLDITPTVTGDLTPLQYRLPPAEKIRIDDLMLDARSTLPNESICAPSAFIDCACGKTRFAITPYGEMNLCTAFPIPRYSLRGGTVAEGWEILKRTVDEARPTARDECPSCPVRPHCRQGRVDAYLETGDMSVCLPHFKDWADRESRADALLDPRHAR